VIPFPALSALRKTFFWRMFANYFVLILIPVIIACVLVHLLVLRLIEDDARKLNEAVMNQFTKQIDMKINTLKTDMVHLLQTSNIRSLLNGDRNKLSDPLPRAELIHGLREQLVQLQSHDLVSKAYLYFVHEDLVIDAEIYTNKSYYFEDYQRLNEAEREELRRIFTSKKMMKFIRTKSNETIVVISYPFHTDTPDVYLTIYLQQDRLKQLIRVGQDWVAGTAIVNSEGMVLTEAGSAIDSAEFGAELTHDMAGPQFLINGEKALTVIPTQFADSWFYLSMIDLESLMKPAKFTRLFIWIFLLFFIIVGGGVSYGLSRRMYKPIHEIKEGWKSHHDRLSQLISGMLPIVHEHFLAKILLGNYRDDLSIESYAKEIGFVYQKKAARTVFCLQLHFSDDYEAMTESSRSYLITELKERIQRLIPEKVWICQTKPDLMAVVIHKDSLFYLSAADDANMLKLALQLYSQYFKATIGIGKTVQSMEELHLSYAAAESVLQHRRICSDVEICDVGFAPPSYDNFLTVQEVTRIFNQYKSKEFDKMLQSALKVIDDGIRNNATVVQMKYLCVDILNTWIRALETERRDVDISLYAKLFHQMNRCVTGDEMKACFEEIHRVLFSKSAYRDRSETFKEILAYIQEHYHEDISVEHFAEKLQMSVGHFSRTFKEVVGEKYVEYIAKVRLQKAKELLLETDLKIDDIATKVGYWGRNSFIRMFRKYEGITPAQYRAIHQQ